jgi:hypothetical protein
MAKNITVRLHLSSGEIVEGVCSTEATKSSEVFQSLVAMKHNGTAVMSLRRKDTPEKGGLFVLTRNVLAIELC